MTRISDRREERGWARTHTHCTRFSSDDAFLSLARASRMQNQKSKKKRLIASFLPPGSGGTYVLPMGRAHCGTCSGHEMSLSAVSLAGTFIITIGDSFTQCADIQVSPCPILPVPSRPNLAYSM